MARTKKTKTDEKMAIDPARLHGNPITKSRQKRNGEVFTPPDLINKMLDQLPEDIWLPGKTVLEPAARNGQLRHRSAQAQVGGRLYAGAGYFRCLCRGVYGGQCSRDEGTSAGDGRGYRRSPCYRR